MDDISSAKTTVAADPRNVGYTQIMYALHAASIAIGVLSTAFIVTAFVFGLPSIIAVIMNYARRNQVRDTWLESHFSWQLRTFWFSLLVPAAELLPHRGVVDLPNCTRMDRSPRPTPDKTCLSTPMRNVLAILIAASLLAACGQRGALYLPGEQREKVDPPAPAAAPSPAPGPDATTDESESNARRNRTN
jgi:uncharacterized membrane protein/predicted small lipoprotein YifL